MKAECFNYIKDLLKFLPEERVKKVEEILKKLSNEDAKTYTSEFIKKEKEAFKRNLRDKIFNIEKLNLLTEKIDKKMQTTISKSFLKGKEEKADWNQAIKEVFYNNNGEDLFYKRLQNVNERTIPLLQDFNEVDADLTKKMFSRTNTQKWQKINPITTKGEKSLNNYIKNMSDDIRRELNWVNMEPERQPNNRPTENKKAQQYADIIKKHIDPIFDYLEVDKLEGYAGAQRHNKAKDTPKKKWVEDIIDKYGIDIGRTFKGIEIKDSVKYENNKFSEITIIKDEVEQVIKREEIENFLYRIKEQVDNGSFSDELYSSKSLRARFNRLQSRSLFLKDVDAEIKYNDEYNGGENILVQAKNQIKQLAELQSTYDNLGTEPVKLLNSLQNDYRAKNIKEDLKFDFSVKNGQITPENTLNVNAGHFIKAYLEPSTNDNSFGKFMKGFRALKGSLGLLPKLAITYISDTASPIIWGKLQGKKVKTGTFLDVGNKFVKTLQGILHAPVSATGIGQATRDELEKEVMKLGLTTKAVHQDIERFLAEKTTGVKLIDALTDISFSSTDYINNLHIKLGHEFLTKNFLEDFASSFKDLPKTRQSVYKKYNLTAEEFELAKNYMVKEIEGEKGFFTDLVKEIPDEEISKIARGDILNKYGSKTERTIDLARKDLKNKFDVWYQKSIDELNGEDRIGAKTLLQRNTKSGTIEGELARSFSELQTWTWTFFNKYLKAIVNHPELNRKQKLGTLATFGTISMIFSYVSRSASSLASGRLPESLIDENGNPNAETIIKAMEYAGLFTPYGEYGLKFTGKSGRSKAFKENSFKENVILTTFGASLGGTINEAGKKMSSLMSSNSPDEALDKFLNKDNIAEFVIKQIPQVNIMQPIITSLISLNFLLSDERVADITNNAIKNHRDYIIPTKNN